MDVRWTGEANSWQRAEDYCPTVATGAINKKKSPFNLLSRFWQVRTHEKEEEKSDFVHKGTMMMSFEGGEGGAESIYIVAKSDCNIINKGTKKKRRDEKKKAIVHTGE
jgi:hypothetical protein